MKPYYESRGIALYLGDSLSLLRDFPGESVNCCVTSPPYWGLRDYGVAGQLGLEKTPEEYIAKMVEVFREVRRVLRSDGTCWVNMGDSYASSPPGNKTTGVSGSSTLHGVNGESGRYRDTLSRSVQTKQNTIVGALKPKDLVGIPWMLAFALRADGWWLRQDIIWSKPNPMPESVTDRCTKSHEYLFLLTKSARYFYDAEAIKEPSQANEESQKRAEYGRYAATDGKAKRNFRTGKPDYLQALGNGYGGESRNKRSVWEIATQPFAEAHFATFPEDLIKSCILAGCPTSGIVLDPFGGSMTTMKVARDLNCNGMAIELNAEYIEIGKRRLSQDVFDFQP